MRPKHLTGDLVENSLERAGITCNKNAIPFDMEKPSVTSGIRLGSPAGTSRGFGVSEFRRIGEIIGDVIDGLAENGEQNNSKIERKAKSEVLSLCQSFPLYRGLYAPRAIKEG